MNLARVAVVVVALCGAGTLGVISAVGRVATIYVDMHVSGPQPALFLFSLRPVSSAIVIMTALFALVAYRMRCSVLFLSGLIVLQVSIGAAYGLACWQAMRLLSH